ncbi:hypothetical protein V6N11_019044 [Hibiscus sabdariffa]|uniref:Secreted protein n=1 Tax=Hibiscus sabdariffa TaxID=183260 RepID=A0ABR2R1L9_9ROSI
MATRVLLQIGFVPSIKLCASCSGLCLMLSSCAPARRAQSLSLTSILVVVDVVAGGSTEKVVHDGSKVSLASSFSDLSPQPLGSTTYLPNRPR